MDSSLSFLPMVFTYQSCTKPAKNSGIRDTKIPVNDLQSKAMVWEWCCLGLFKSLLLAWQGACCKLLRQDWEVSEWGWLRLESNSFLQQTSTAMPDVLYLQIHFIFVDKKVLVLTECADDIARCTGRAGSKGVRCSDRKLILGVWEKPFENHGLHLDLLSYYCPVAVKVWPWGSDKDIS